MILFYDSELFLQHLRHPEKLNLHKTQHVPGENILFCNMNSLTHTDSFHVLLFLLLLSFRHKLQNVSELSGCVTTASTCSIRENPNTWRIILQISNLISRGSHELLVCLLWPLFTRGKTQPVNALDDLTFSLSSTRICPSYFTCRASPIIDATN